MAGADEVAGEAGCVCAEGVVEEPAEVPGVAGWELVAGGGFWGVTGAAVWADAAIAKKRKAISRNRRRSFRRCIVSRLGINPERRQTLRWN